MYKVFIENTSLHIIEKKDLIPTNALILFEDNLELIKEKLIKLIQSNDNELPIFIISQSIDETFSKLFQDFMFIEAAGGIVKRKDSYLFIKRNGFWDIPKGKLDPGEFPEIAAVREIEEECGIKGPIIEEFIGHTYHTYYFKNNPVIKKTYWYSLNYKGTKNLTPQTEEGITKAKWFKESEIIKIRKNTYSSIIDVIEMYFDKKMKN